MIIRLARPAFLFLILASTLLGQANANLTTVKIDSLRCSAGYTSGEFKLLTWGTGVTLPVSLAGTISIGRTQIAALTITKLLDDCSPELFRMATKGTHSTTLTLTEKDRTGHDLLIVTLEEVFVSSYSSAESTGDTTLPGETVAFTFGLIRIKYVPSSHVACWDLRKAVECGL